MEFVSGKFGTQALDLGDGGVLRFRLPAQLDKDTGTVELWARPDWLTADGKRHTLVDMNGPGAWNQNRLRLSKNLNYEVGFVIWDRNKRTLAVKVPINILRQAQWTHICATWDTGQGLRFYVNGELRRSAEGQLDIERLNTMTLGSGAGSDRSWVGTVDELRVSRGQREAVP